MGEGFINGWLHLNVTKDYIGFLRVEDFHFHVLRQRLANFRFLLRTIKSTRVDYESPLKLEAEQGVTTDVMYEGEVPVWIG